MTRPSHPSGYPVADDAPAFVAPALDLRLAVEATASGAVEDAVLYTLAFPIVERVRSHAPDLDSEATAPHAPAVHHEPEYQDDDADTAVDLPAIDGHEAGADDSETTIERDYYRDSGEETLLATERETLEHSLRSLGPFDAAPDLDVERPPADRVTLARARAIRFRLALLDVWPEDASSPAPADELVDLFLHPAIVVAFADGAPVDARGVSETDADLVRTLVDARPNDVTRATLRDAGASACARVTLLGTRRAVDYLRDRFDGAPGAERRASLAVAARLAAGARDDDPRAIALALLRDALG